MKIKSRDGIEAFDTLPEDVRAVLIITNVVKWVRNGCPKQEML